MIIDFDKAITSKVATVLNRHVSFMPENMFERKRVMDAVKRSQTFSFASIWRSNIKVDFTRWDPILQWSYEVGVYTNEDKSQARLFRLIPVIFTYNLTIWEVSKESISGILDIFLSGLMRDPIVTVMDSETNSLEMRCLILHDASLDEDLATEKEDVVTYHKSTFPFTLEGWMYQYEQEDRDLILGYHLLYVNENGILLEERHWDTDDDLSGGSGLSGNAPSGESGHWITPDL